MSHSFSSFFNPFMHNFHYYLDRDACKGMVSGLQPQASSIEFWGNEKPYQNLMNISAKQNLIVIYHYVLFDWFLNFSLKQPSWRQGEGGMHF
jgi:hypothetical protein